jgi:long-chain acyl-CoA synthetase
MKSYDVPLLVDPVASDNVTDLLIQRVKLTPNQALFERQKPDGTWFNVSAAEFQADVESLAKGLIAAGIKPGQAIGLMSRTRYEWTLIDFAIWFAGAVSVPIYETSSAAQIEWILSNSDAVALFIETDALKERFGEVKGKLPNVSQVWVIEGNDIAELRKVGKSVGDGDLEAARKNAQGQDLATIVYTSGTTGNPKGCELTHASFVDHCRNAAAELPEVANDKQNTVMFLPLAHILGRYVAALCLHAGIRVAHLSDPKQVATVLPVIKPTILVAVPRVFEKVYNGAELRAEAGGKGKIFRAAAETAIAYSRALDTKAGPSIGLKVKFKLFDKLVYSKLRAAMGGKIQYAISGGAPLGERLGHFFRAI